MLTWAQKKEDGEITSSNLQLHPPRWEKGVDNITSNTSGNLKLPLVYESRQLDVPGILVMQTIFFDESVMMEDLSEAVARD